MVLQAPGRSDPQSAGCAFAAAPALAAWSRSCVCVCCSCDCPARSFSARRPRADPGRTEAEGVVCSRAKGRGVLC